VSKFVDYLRLRLSSLVFFVEVWCLLFVSFRLFSSSTQPSGMVMQDQDAGVAVCLTYQVEGAVLEKMLKGMSIEHLSHLFATSLARMAAIASPETRIAGSSFA
jgi:hypothetical protein